jgi:hypothetical protein
VKDLCLLESWTLGLLNFVRQMKANVFPWFKFVVVRASRSHLPSRTVPIMNGSKSVNDSMLMSNTESVFAKTNLISKAASMEVGKRSEPLEVAHE